MHTWRLAIYTWYDASFFAAVHPARAPNFRNTDMNIQPFKLAGRHGHMCLAVIKKLNDTLAPG